MKKYRGSRKHVLDWVENPKFPKQITKMLVPTGAVVTADDIWMPLGYHDPKEARFESFGPKAIPDLLKWDILSDWWLIHKRGANTPNWDLASTCNISGKKGLILVEAKANASELKADGKVLDPSASENSRENHHKISHAINEANVSLNEIIPGVSISRDSHYQLSNRIAFSWKLASLGIPIVLVYLGFCGDMGITNVGEPIKDQHHWNQLMQQHTIGILPDDFFDRKFECGPSTFQLIVRSRQVKQYSSIKNH
jgi:hypothetical protein